MARPFDAGLLMSAIQLRMDVVAALDRKLFLLDHERMRFGEGILAHSGHLPGYLHSRLASCDDEAAALNFLRDVEVRAGRADGGELVAKVLVQDLEPSRSEEH